MGSRRCPTRRRHLITLAMVGVVVVIVMMLSSAFHGPFVAASSFSADEAAMIEEADRMAQKYTEQLEILVSLLENDDDDNDDNNNGSFNSNNLPSEQDLAKSKRKAKKIIEKGERAFQAALEAFPDDSLPHAHALFAKLCVKMHQYEKSLSLFDEAIRRASLPLEALQDNDEESNNGTSTTNSNTDHEEYNNDPEMIEAQHLVKQLVLERNRSRFQFLQSKIHSWDMVNNRFHRGGIPPETSPKDPWNIANLQLEIFPNPHPRTVFEMASWEVLLLDSPDDEIDDGTADDNNFNGEDGVGNDASENVESNAHNAITKAWEAHKKFARAQTWSFGAYIHGKKRHLAGGITCQGGSKEDGFGILVGGSAWSRASSQNFPLKEDDFTTNMSDRSSSFTGTVLLENVILSGRDAVPSGYGSDCRVYVPHRYVDLSNNLPMVTSWETSISELTLEDSPFWLTYIPENDAGAYDGTRGKGALGNEILIIPDPSKKVKKGSSSGRIVDEGRGFDSAVLLTGYAADNYYHFVSEVLPSLVLMKERIQNSLASDNAKDVVIVPNLQHEFVEGFLRLMLPESFANENGSLSKKIVQWGRDKKPGHDTGNLKFSSPHPISFVRRLYAAAWDQPEQAPPPGGPAHCLTPAPLLRKMQRAVWKAVGVSPDNRTTDAKLKIVYCSRSSSPTRKLKEEQELLSRLENVASAMNAALHVFEKANTDYNSANTTSLQFLTDTINLFASADVVVGVHGASLANIAFARVGTTVVELGLEGVPQASHYRHLSKSLDLKHVDVFLKKDARSLGATEVELRLGVMNDVVGAVVEGLDEAVRRRKSGGHHAEL